MRRLWTWFGLVAALSALLAGVQRLGLQERGARSGGPLVAVATTGMVADAVREVGGDHVRVTGLMGPGVDPHLFKASEGDVGRMAAADIVFFGGLHLEGRMSEVLGKMASRKVVTVAVAEAIPPDRLLSTSGGQHDPHVWFDVALWCVAVGRIRDALVEADPGHADEYIANAGRYLARLADLDRWVREQVSLIPPDRRVLVTAHDAFGYFGRAYGVEVRGVQGISTVTEAGAADLSALADVVASRRIPAVFVESSVSPRVVEALIAAVRARGGDVREGGSLFSDALGPSGTPEGTYVGMVEYNVRTIVGALKGGTPGEGR